MKFEKTLQAESIEDWKPHYINYVHLKAFIRKISQSEQEKQQASSQNLFFSELDKQLIQCNSFFEQKEVQSEKKYLHLKERCKEFFSKLQTWSFKTEDVINSWLLTFSSFANELNELKNFAELNIVGFKKILKKYSRRIQRQNGTNIVDSYFKEKIESSSFYHQKILKSLLPLVQKELDELYKIRSKIQLQSNVQKLVSDQYSIEEIVLKAIENGEEEILSKYLVGEHPGLAHIAIIKAVSSGNLKILKFLNEQLKLPLNIKNELDQTLLHITTSNTLEFLLEKKIFDVEAEDCNGKKAIHIYAEKGLSECISIIYKQVPSLQIDSIDQNGNTPLILAAKGNSIAFSEVIKKLLELGADANTPNKFSKFPIHIAAYNGNENTLLALLQHSKLNINAIDGKKQTALHIATKHNKSRCSEILLQFNARVDLQDSDGWSPIHSAARNGNLEILKLLLLSISSSELERVVNLQDTEGSTALHIAARLSRVHCAKLLLQLKADVDIEDVDGYTPDVYATYCGEVELGDLLASKNRKQKDSQVPSLQNLQTKTFSNENSNSKRESKNTKTLCKVKFKIRATTSIGEFVAILGDRKVLGAWNHNYAFPLTQDRSEKDLWSGEVNLPYGAVTEYRYVIMQGSVLIRWESLPEHRKVQPEFSEQISDDETFGVNSKVSTSDIFTEEGWLANQSQVRIRFSENAVNLFDSTSKVKVSVSTGEPLGNSYSIVFPLPFEDPCDDKIFQGFNLEKLSSLKFDVFEISSGIKLGRASISPSQLKSCFGDLTIPIMNTQLNVIGEISFRFLIIKPFNHPKLNKVLQKTYWRGTLLIGHRGGGADKAAKIGKYHRTHVRENTILSFTTAASLGAEYVEFDVHLTKDRVPVIYHDFEIVEEGSVGIAELINRITLEKFKQIVPKSHSTPKSSRTRVRSSSWESATCSLKDIKLPVNNGEQQISDSLPTLEDLFKRIREEVGFNVEIKYPNAEQQKQLSLTPYERNEYIDAILSCVFEHAGNRNIIFSTFDPDVCLLLRLKQPKYPVFFLTVGGVKHVQDPRWNSLEQAVRFAKINHLMGIVTYSRPLVKVPQLIGMIKKAGLLLLTWGGDNNSKEHVEMQEKLGVDAIISDHVSYVHSHLKSFV